MKRNIMFALLMMSIMLLSGLMIVEARDSRYNNSFYWETTPYNTEMNGTQWQFKPSVSHWILGKYTWFNKFANVIAQPMGHVAGFFKLRILEPFTAWYHDDALATLRLFVEPLSNNFGFKMTADFSGYNYGIYINCSRLDSSSSALFWINDYRNYDFGMEAKMSLSNGASGRKGVGSCHFFKISRSGGIVTTLYSMDIETPITTFAQDAKVIHEVDMNYGVMGQNCYWQAYYEIRSIGVRPDVANEDCVVDIFDITTVSAVMDKQKGVNIPTYDWFWTTNCWKADVNEDGIIDIFDISYISLHFGETY